MSYSIKINFIFILNMWYYRNNISTELGCREELAIAWSSRSLTILLTPGSMISFLQYVYGINCGDGFADASLSSFSQGFKFYILNTYSFLFVNHTSVKRFKKKDYPPLDNNECLCYTHPCPSFIENFKNYIEIYH